MRETVVDPRLVAWLKSIARILAVMVTIIGLAALLGWLFDVVMLAKISPNQIPMKFNTALAFVLCGISLFNLHRRPRLAQIAASMVVLIGLLTLFEYATGLNLGIDQWVVIDREDLLSPGRMSLITAFNFTLVGCALLSFASARVYGVAQWFALLALLNSTLTILGYVYGAEELYGIFLFKSVSMYTGLSFVLLCIGFLLATSERGPARILSSYSLGGYIVRYFLPIVFCMPLLFGWLFWHGARLGLYNLSFAIVLFTLANMLILSVLTVWLGYTIHTIDYERVDVLAALRRSQADLEAKVDARTADLRQSNQVLEQEIAQRKQIEQSLRDKEEQLQTIFDLLPVGASLIDQEQRIVRMNRALERIMAMNEPDLLTGAYRARTYIHRDGTPLQADEFPSHIALRAQQVVSDVEIGVVKENGETIWTSVSAAPLPSNHGVVVVTSNITERIHAEQVLRQSEEQFRATFKNAAVGMAIVSMEGAWLRINQALCDIVGYSRDELLTMTFQQISHPDDLALDFANMQRLIQNELQSYHMEKRYFHKAGHIIWVLLSVSLVRNSQGEPLHYVSQIQDLTDRKAADEALRMRLAEEQEFQRQLKALHEISLELMLIEDLDIFYRRAVEYGLSRLGYERLGLLLYDKKLDRATGTYGTDAQGQVVAEYHIDLKPANLTSILQRALNDKEHFVFDEQATLFADAKPIGVGWNAAAVLWNGTENTGWLAADNAVEHKPVTKSMLGILSLYALTLGTLLVQKKTLQALRESEFRFRRAITYAPFPVMIHAEDGEVVNLSQVWSEITGYLPQEISTIAAWTAAAYGSKATAVQEMIRKTYALEGPFKGGEFTIRTKWGHERIWDFIAAPLGHMPDGRRMVSSMAMDITERKAAEEALRKLNVQLQQANQEVQQFAYIVSHDLRAPLINLKGFSEILRGAIEQLGSLSAAIEPTLDSSQQQLWQSVTQEKIPMAVRFINTAADRMDQFTSAILKLSRLGHRPLTLEHIHTKSLVEQVVQSLLPHSTPHAVTITLGELPDVEADRLALDQIFGNIISNAIKYLDPQRNGEITIWGTQAGGQSTFHIRDNGRGITEAQFDKIFAPFRRGITDVEGDGMGLAYVQALVKRYQGSIWFESTPDIGTVFSFSIFQRNELSDDTA